MLNQNFSAFSLTRLLKKGELRQYLWAAGSSKSFRDELKTAEKDISLGSFSFSSLCQKSTSKAEIFSLNDLPEKLVERKLSENIRALYGIRFTNRDLSVSQIKSLLDENVEKYVIKVDIKSFYENIDRTQLITNMLNDNILSSETKHVLRSLFFHNDFHSVRGIPRGLSTSAFLSEIFMRDFDRTASRLKGVYFYTRYVDDIIVFSYEHPKSIEESLKTLLFGKYHLPINSRKSDTYPVMPCACEHGKQCRCIGGKKCMCHNGCVCGKKLKEHLKAKSHPSSTPVDDPRGFHGLEYLGYKFYFPKTTTDNNDKHTVVTADISDKKISKLKRRIVKSIKYYENDGDFNTLKERVSFLTSNYTVSRRNGGSLFAGTHFSYKAVDRVGSCDRLQNGLDGFAKLDKFFREILFSRGCNIGIEARKTLTIDQRRDLARFSFSKGNSDIVLRHFTASEIQRIMKAWIDEKN